ncbi:MAG: 2OG-Fe(II) oxygenase [Gammaproteobacteria bacterium]|nr:2OG-Fe(II) oxygenase [Gammaproteobacteria bacterium]
MALGSQGWIVIDEFLSQSLVQQLREESRETFAQGQFHVAGLGHGNDRVIDTQIRNDRVKWLDVETATSAQSAYLARLEALRLNLNRSLQLGLFELECMLAVYPAGSFYKRHRDQFRGIGLRTVSVITYLNADWEPGNGGELRLYHQPGDDTQFQDIAPLGGRLVCFLSEEFEHEVLTAKRERLSLTGWFKQRP